MPCTDYRLYDIILQLCTSFYDCQHLNLFQVWSQSLQACEASVIFNLSKSNSSVVSSSLKEYFFGVNEMCLFQIWTTIFEWVKSLTDQFIQERIFCTSALTPVTFRKVFQILHSRVKQCQEFEATSCQGSKYMTYSYILQLSYWCNIYRTLNCTEGTSV